MDQCRSPGTVAKLRASGNGEEGRAARADATADATNTARSASAKRARYSFQVPISRNASRPTSSTRRAAGRRRCSARKVSTDVRAAGALELDGREAERRLAGDRQAYHGDALCRGGDAAVAFCAADGRWDEPDGVEGELLARFLGGSADGRSGSGRRCRRRCRCAYRRSCIAYRCGERSTAGALSSSCCRRRSAIRAHVRIWPLPWITYLYVVSSRSPIGPRACRRLVEMPTSAPKPNS